VSHEAVVAAFQQNIEKLQKVLLFDPDRDDPGGPRLPVTPTP